MPDPTPALSQEEYLKVRYEYEAGSYRSITELAQRYNISVQTLHSRIKREKWAEHKQSLLIKANKQFEKDILSESKEWIDRVKARSKKDWSIIDESIDTMVSSTGGIEASDLRNYIQARKALDDMIRRSLNLVDPSQNIDITSKGQSLGESLISAIEKVRSNPVKLELSQEERQRIMEAEIIDDPEPKMSPNY